ncbi:MAG: hypothetical protein HYY26_03010 [Acidobacteria bacterium]|nr:hypothetical protein [Acidobacteriota bacterium]
MAEASKAEAKAAAPVGARPYVLAALGWVVPGLGHLLQRKFDRGIVFLLSIGTMATLGLAMGAKVYPPALERGQGLFVAVLHLLGFLGELGAGMFYGAAWLAGWGESYMSRAVGDYGTVFFLCAGLLNLLTALDAYDIAAGKKE